MTMSTWAGAQELPVSLGRPLERQGDQGLNVTASSSPVSSERGMVPPL